MRPASVPARPSSLPGIGAIAAALCGSPACSTSSAAPHEKAAPSAIAAPPAPAPSATVAAPPPSRCEGVRCVSIERCDEAAGQCVPACPAGAVYIPATGPEGFVMGRGFTMNGRSKSLGKGHTADSDRPHKVVLTRPFCMDETEVTVAAMLACVDAGKCDAPKIYEVRANYPGKLDHPVNEVSWPKAKKFCEAQGKSLPTEAQWEWAATGGDGRKWPWGDEFPVDCSWADFTIGPLISPGGDSGCHGGGSSPVKAHPKGNKIWPSGALYDLAGNVWEWCEDTYAPYPEGEVTDPLVRSSKVIVHVVRGGGWNRSARGIEAGFRGAAIYTYEVGGLGFRCVQNPAEGPTAGPGRSVIP
jgi:formylglycine-generating enzyme required for sulfatase activity